MRWIVSPRVCRGIALAQIAVIALGGGVSHAQAQTVSTAPPAAPGLAAAVDAAWQRQPAARALTARLDEFAARRGAAGSLLPEAPALSASNRNDRLNRNTGVSEWDVAVALPLWLPGYQSRTLALVESEQGAFEALVGQARWRLAGEVREAYWQARLAENERIVANRRADDAARLSEDVRRRVAAGELARMDLNQAQGAEQAALAVQAESEARAHRARRAFTALTGLATLPDEAAARETLAALPAMGPAGLSHPDQPASPPGSVSSPMRTLPAGTADASIALRRPASIPVDDGPSFDAPLSSAETAHPLLAPLARAIEAARARLAVARGNVRDYPELAVGMRRERGSFDGPWESSATVAVRIPLATDARNRPRIAAASAELTEAEAILPVERARLAAEQDASAREVEQSAIALARAEQRLALAAETQREYARAFQLGNIDLPQRLRIEFDRFDAELTAARARIEAARAIARRNQSLGLLP